MVLLDLEEDLVLYSSMRYAVEAAKRDLWTVLMTPPLLTVFITRMLLSAVTLVGFDHSLHWIYRSNS